MTNPKKNRVLIFVVAYNAERTIESVLARIPVSLADKFDVEILAIDDSSPDRTFEVGYKVEMAGSSPFPLRVLFNPVNQGYGGNQKIGYHYAIKSNFDFVALLHGDGQYAPEVLPELLKPLDEGIADAVFGSRMLNPGAARKGGMPLYKFVGNKILTSFQNRMLHTNLSEFHSGYRIYSVSALKKLPFDRNTNDFHFDTEIIIQLIKSRMRIQEIAIPTYYGDEICHVNGLKYAWEVTKSTIRSRAHELSVFYDSKFDCDPEHEANAHYEAKIGYPSSHSAVLDLVPAGSKVVEMGCAGGHLCALLERQRGCKCTGVDIHPLPQNIVLNRFIQHDLNVGPPELAFTDYDYVLLLDVIEHLVSPEVFLDRLRESMKFCTRTKLVVTTPNVGFISVRLMLLFGQFNYGKRGILDLTHKRLFTIGSIGHLFEQRGFQVSTCRGIPAPFPLALGLGSLSRFLLGLNKLLIRLLPALFSYQVMIVAEPRPSLEVLLHRAEEESAARVQAMVSGS